VKKIIILFSITTILAFGLDIKGLYLKSYNYEKMGSYQDAIKVLIPINKKYGHTYTINLRLGWLFFLDKKYKNSIKHYKKALIAIPTSIEAKLGLTKCYLASGKLNSAVATSGSILKVDYYNYYGNYYLASALIAKKDYYSAKAVVEKMLSLYPSSVIFLEQLAKIKKALEPKKVAKIYESIEILDPNNLMVIGF